MWLTMVVDRLSDEEVLVYFDNHMKYPQENNIPCDYCLTIFNRIER